MIAATMCLRLSCCWVIPDGAGGSATGMCRLSTFFASAPAPRVIAKLSSANWSGSSSASSTLFMASLPPSNLPLPVPKSDPVESTWSMLLRRFSFPPAELESAVAVDVLWLFTSYWFMEPRRIENQRDSREKGSDEMEGEELVELGEPELTAVADTSEADPGFITVCGIGEVVAADAVVDIVDACTAFRPLLKWMLGPGVLLLLLLLTRSAIRRTLPPAPPPAAATCC